MKKFSRKHKFKNNRATNRESDTSWEKVSDWYNKKTGDKGHFFHETVIIPKSLDLLNLKIDSSLLDLGCGQGIISRNIPKEIGYVGIDLSESLIKFAKQRNNNPNFKFVHGDVSKKIEVEKKDFTHCVIILALQNIEDMDGVFKTASLHLQHGGKFLIILNHPAFRIPRQTSWEIDERNQIQCRRINRYQTSLKIPINMNPGKGGDKLTWSFHNPISAYSENLYKNGFFVEKIEEWVSPKESQGKAAKMENRAREEFPMFMAILAVKGN